MFQKFNSFSRLNPIFHQNRTIDNGGISLLFLKSNILIYNLSVNEPHIAFS